MLKLMGAAAAYRVSGRTAGDIDSIFRGTGISDTAARGNGTRLCMHASCMHAQINVWTSVIFLYRYGNGLQ
jgi:hypothetical protein